MKDIDNERRLVCSRIRTPDGTVLESLYTHDFVSHVDKNGETYFLDGGADYQRMSVNKVSAEDCSIYSDAPFEVVRENLKRGTFDGNGNRVWKPLCELSDEHLANILVYNRERGLHEVYKWYDDYIMEEQEYRRKHGITVKDFRNKKE